MSLDWASHIEFVEAEFRRQSRTVIDQITLPIARRVDQFTCWPGLRLLRSSTAGSELQLAFKRNPSKLRVGEHVYVNDQAANPADVMTGAQGIIVSIDEHKKIAKVKPSFQQNSRFERAFRIDDTLVLDQTLPTLHIGLEMPRLALELIAGRFGEAPRLKRIRSLLDGSATARPTTDTPFDPTKTPELASLTEAQIEAVRRAIEQDFSLIQGPPGTGKTLVLGMLIRELVRRGLKVGVCAFTHLAINNVLQECLKYEDISEVCKLGGANHWRGPRDLPRFRAVEKPSQFFRQKTTPPVTGFTQHGAFQPIGRALGRNDSELPGRFDVIVFDEAGQLTLSAAVMAMVHSDRFVFAGDHAQLPPMVSTTRPGEGHGKSVFQILAEEAGHDSVLLDRTFRMNRELCAFPSEEFYGGHLKAADAVAERRLEVMPPKDPTSAQLLDPGLPDQLALVAHEGRGQESPEEAALVARLVDDAIRGGVPAEEIAVVAPHRRQNVKIRELVAKLGHTGTHPLFDTVERIQGQERDLIILSMTLSDPDILSSESEFLFLPNRFNVAITRARKKLIVVASRTFFRTLPRRGVDHRRLGGLNVLKRWYFSHRAGAVDATALARRTLEGLEGHEKASEEPAAP